MEEPQEVLLLPQPRLPPPPTLPKPSSKSAAGPRSPPTTAGEPPSARQSIRTELQPAMSSPTASPADAKCNMCGCVASQLCPSCNNQLLCDACDDLFHRHPSRANHKRAKVAKEGATSLMFPVVLFLFSLVVNLFFFHPLPSHAEICTICGIAPVHAHCLTCVQSLCLKCDMLYHSHPERKGHQRSVTAPTKTSRSEQERVEAADGLCCAPTSLFFCCSSSPSLSPWECSHCTTVNEMRAVLCTTCERPRLATAASLLQDSLTSLPSSPNSGESSLF